VQEYLKKIIWFTGLSGSGKSTLSTALIKKLKRRNYKILKLDGDIFRKKNFNKNSFSKLNIIKNNLEIIKYVKKKQNKQDFIIISVISPLKITRIKAKKTFGKNYLEVLVKCPLTELVKRDTKGFYKLAKEKKINNLIGYNSKILYEKTKYKKILINTKMYNLSESITKIIHSLNKEFKINV
jgi:adenylylsulfate kinase